MKPVLVDFGSIELTSYGLSKALAALAAGFILARELRPHRATPSTPLAHPSGP